MSSDLQANPAGAAQEPEQDTDLRADVEQFLLGRLALQQRTHLQSGRAHQAQDRHQDDQPQIGKAALATAGMVQAAEPTAQQKQLREIYKEMVETNTTNSVGSCTVAVTKVAKRLKAAGYKDADMQIIVPPGGPTKGNLVARLKGDGSKKPLLLLAHVDVVHQFGHADHGGNKIGRAHV